MKPEDMLQVEIEVRISNPANFNERLTFRDERKLQPRSFEDIAKILSAFNELFQKIK